MPHSYMGVVAAAVPIPFCTSIPPAGSFKIPEPRAAIAFQAACSAAVSSVPQTK